MSRTRVLVFLLTLLVSSLALLAAAPARHVVLISIDGMRPASYTSPGPAKIPTLRALAARGAYARGVVGVLPTVTYPSHTTMITGVPPAIHGIVNNTWLDPEGRAAGAWYWYARDIKVPTLPGLIRASGMTAAAVSWPVTVGMDLDYNVPEHFRSRHPEALSLLRALSTPRHLIDGYESSLAAPMPWPPTDDQRTGLTAWIIRTFKPQLHDAPHLRQRHGVARVRAGLARGAGRARTQRRAGRDASSTPCATAGLADRTDIVIVSDHGFVSLQTQLQPNFAFKQDGLIQVNERGVITTWDAYLQSAGGAGFVYLEAARRRGAGGACAAGARRDRGRPGQRRRPAVDARGPAAHRRGARGELRVDDEGRVLHGDVAHRAAAADHRQRRAWLRPGDCPPCTRRSIMAGPDVTRTGDLGVVRMTQIAPTLARWFGVRLVAEADQPLW